MGQQAMLRILSIVVRTAVSGPYPERTSLVSVIKNCLPGVLSFSRELARVINLYPIL